MDFGVTRHVLPGPQVPIKASIPPPSLQHLAFSARSADSKKACFSIRAISERAGSEPASHSTSKLVANAVAVQSLLMEICDETSVAELMLKVGDFRLRVKRDVGKLKGASSILPIAVAPPIPTAPMVESAVASVSTAVVPASPSKSSSSSVAALLASPASGSRFGLLEGAADEGLHFVTSPKVGLFRKSRVVKGKSGRPLCEEGQSVKEGQVVCYVEQLGTQQPVEAENSGEVMKVLCKDGEPVGYGDPLIAIRPAFPGIK